MKKIISIILIFCFLAIPFNYASAANTYSTNLERDDTQYWDRDDGDLVGLKMTGNISGEAWVKLESLTGRYIILSRWRFSGNNNSYNFYINNDGRVTFKYSSTGVLGQMTREETNDVVATVGIWVHLAFTADVSAQVIKLYVNGSLVDSNTLDTDASSIKVGIANFIIGVDENYAAYYDGLIDEVRVWEGIRTPTEISDNYQLELVGNEANLVGYWKFNNDGEDSTSNGNRLTNKNFATFSTDIPFDGVAPPAITATFKSQKTIINGKMIIK